MLGNLEPEESLFWDEDSLMDQVQSTIDKLGWDPNDDIVVCLLYTSPSPRDS